MSAPLGRPETRPRHVGPGRAPRRRPSSHLLPPRRGAGPWGRLVGDVPGSAHRVQPAARVSTVDQRRQPGYARGTSAVDWEARFDFEALRAKRVARAHDAMALAGLDALLVWKMENVRYLTALRSQVIAGKASILNGALLLPGGAPVLLASGGEVDKANRFMPWLGAVHAVPIMEQRELVEGFVRTTLAPLLREAGADRGRLGVDQVGMALLESLAAELP